MPIQIIDGFKIKDSIPVDDRLVKYGVNQRNSIAYKYQGLRTFDLSDQIPYVWIGSKWQKESLNSVLFYSKINVGWTQSSFNGSTITTSNLLKVWNKETNELINSNITESVYNKNSTIGINFGGKLPDLNYRLDVNGGMKSLKLNGSGTKLTDLNANNFTTGLINAPYIKADLEYKILVSDNLICYWDIPNLSNSDKYIVKYSPLDKEYSLYSVDLNNKIYYNSKMKYNSQIGQLLFGRYSFSDDEKSYYFTNNQKGNLSFYINETNIVDIDSSLKISNGKHLGFLTNDNLNYYIVKNKDDNFSFVNKSLESLNINSNGISLKKIKFFNEIGSIYLTDLSTDIEINKSKFSISSFETSLKIDANDIYIKLKSLNIFNNSNKTGTLFSIDNNNFNVKNTNGINIQFTNEFKHIIDNNLSSHLRYESNKSVLELKNDKNYIKFINDNKSLIIESPEFRTEKLSNSVDRTNFKANKLNSLKCKLYGGFSIGNSDFFKTLQLSRFNFKLSYEPFNSYDSSNLTIRANLNKFLAGRGFPTSSILRKEVPGVKYGTGNIININIDEEITEVFSSYNLNISNNTVEFQDKDALLIDAFNYSPNNDYLLISNIVSSGEYINNSPIYKMDIEYYNSDFSETTISDVDVRSYIRYNISKEGNSYKTGPVLDPKDNLDNLYRYLNAMFSSYQGASTGRALLSFPIDTDSTATRYSYVKGVPSGNQTYAITSLVSILNSRTLAKKYVGETYEQLIVGTSLKNTTVKFFKDKIVFFKRSNSVEQCVSIFIKIWIPTSSPSTSTNFKVNVYINDSLSDVKYFFIKSESGPDEFVGTPKADLNRYCLFHASIDHGKLYTFRYEIVFEQTVKARIYTYCVVSDNYGIAHLTSTHTTAFDQIIYFHYSNGVLKDYIGTNTIDPTTYTPSISSNNDCVLLGNIIKPAKLSLGGGNTSVTGGAIFNNIKTPNNPNWNGVYTVDYMLLIKPKNQN